MASITNDYTTSDDYLYATSTGTILLSGDWTNTSGSVWLDKRAVKYEYGYIPSDIDNIPPIQGNPKGAGWLVSWAYKKKDPVCFVKSKSDMIKIVNDLMRDPRVIKSSIIIHKISAQYKPKEIRRLKKFWAKEITIVKE